ncbi:peptidylprolyl isomerase [Phaeovulum sp.]|uniref:peptidylprolyl isomerase n=1 Tax=Phaeovulum sp. TaxID=2934796 RepID=UPI0039E654A0
MSIVTKFLGATALTLAISGPIHAADLTADSVMATVNGTKITLGHMVAVRDSLPAEYQTLADDVLFTGILDQLIQQTALSEIGAAKMTKRDEMMLEVDRRAYLAGAVLDQTAKSAVTEDGIKTAYDMKYAAAEPTREYNAAHIIVATEDEAKAIKAEIGAGADFAETAKLKSTDGAAAGGGDLGWFGLAAMVKPFGDAVAAMKPGDIAGPVQTEYGWHIIKLIDSRLTEAPSIEDVRAELEGDLRQEAVQARVAEVVEKAKIEKQVEGVDPAILKDTSILGN